MCSAAANGIAAGTGGDVGSSVENLLGGSGSETLVGDADVNLIRGNDGDDTINAKAGVDDVDGGGEFRIASRWRGRKPSSM
ncbi:MAG: hypothetical protein U0939_24405 [Pirellulales bacterium]